MSDLKVYTIKDTAEILQVTTRSVYSYIKSGKLHAVKLGKEWRITQQDIEDLLKTGTR